MRVIFDRFNSLSLKVRIVIMLNIAFSIYYFILFAQGAIRYEDLPILNIIRHGISFIGMVLSAVFLYQEKRIGKTITQFVGILGVVYILGYACLGLTYMGQPGYSDAIVISYTINYIAEIFLKHAYPLFAGFILLGTKHDNLGLT